MTKDPICTCGSGGKVTITFSFNAAMSISRDNFIKGVWNKPAAGWITVMSGVNYIHEINAGTLKITINRHSITSNIPSPVLTHAVWSL
jgi:hypothetical protein